jgi:hypothetical protein
MVARTRTTLGAAPLLVRVVVFYELARVVAHQAAGGFEQCRQLLTPFR